MKDKYTGAIGEKNQMRNKKEYDTAKRLYDDIKDAIDKDKRLYVFGYGLDKEKNIYYSYNPDTPDKRKKHELLAEAIQEILNNIDETPREKNFREKVKYFKFKILKSFKRCDDISLAEFRKYINMRITQDKFTKITEK